MYLAIGGHELHEVCAYPDTNEVLIRARASRLQIMELSQLSA